MANSGRGVARALLTWFALEFAGCPGLMHDQIAAHDDVQEEDGATAGGTGKFASALNVEYGQDKMMKADFYWPADASLKPKAGWSVVLMLPGESASRTMWGGLCKWRVIPMDRACVSADYRKNDKHRKQDVFDLTLWLHDKAPEFDFDPKNILLGGVSMGGLTINNVLWDKKMGEKLLKPGKGGPVLKGAMLLSGTWSNHKGQAKRSKHFPEALLIMSSDNDNKVKYKYSLDLAKQLEKEKAPVTFVNIPQAGHSIWYHKNETKREMWYAELMTFVGHSVP